MRDQDATIGDGDYGGYRYMQVTTIGMLMPWMGQDAPSCDDQLDDWAPITNRAVINIGEFTVDDFAGPGVSPQSIPSFWC